MAWSRVFLFFLAFASLTAAGFGCGDDDYNNDGLGTGITDLSGSVPIDLSSDDGGMPRG